MVYPLRGQKKKKKTLSLSRYTMKGDNLCINANCQSFKLNHQNGPQLTTHQRGHYNCFHH